MKYLALTFLFAINALVYMANKPAKVEKPIIGAQAYQQYVQKKELK